MLNTTNNINNLSSVSWIAQIPGYESLVMKLTDFEIPSVDAGVTALGSRSEFNYQGGGDHIIYENLELSFIVDENLKNYKMIHQWMRNNVHKGQADQESIFVHLLNNNKDFQGVEIEFLYAFPISLGKLSFDTDGSTTDIIGTVTFAYTNFDFVETPDPEQIPITLE